MAVRVEAVAQQSTPSQSHKPSAAQSSSSQTENSNTHTSDEALVTIRRIIEAEDYYEVLGVSREQSNPSLFRTQYIKLSKKIHPDKHLDNPEATNAFQKLANAYETLRCAKSRYIYDLQGHGVNVPSEGALSDLVHHIYNEFYEGEYATLLEFVERVNAEHPELHIEPRIVEQVLLETKKLIDDVENAFSEVKIEYRCATVILRDMQQLQYLNVAGRLACMFNITRILLGMPVKLFKIPVPPFVYRTMDSVMAQADTAKSFATNVASRATGAVSGMSTSVTSRLVNLVPFASYLLPSSLTGTRVTEDASMDEQRHQSQTTDNETERQRSST